MATTVQFRRGNTADNNNFTGKLGEITVDTDKWQLRVHDNVTPGGHTINNITNNIGSGNAGTVTSVGLSGGTTGLLVSTTGSIYSNITASGTFTLAGTLNVANGGTGTANPVMTATAPLAVTGTWPNVTVALTGTVGTANGGTGVTAAPAANQVLLGTGSGYALTTLVAGNGVTFDQTQNNILTIKSSGGTGSGNTITLADMPPGSIQWFAMQTPPAGWLECNGSILSRTANTNQYAPLWAAIQYTYGGSGDSFKIPDLRGQFLRGWDNGRGVDASRAFGSTQADDFKAHSHEFDIGQGAGTLSKQLGGWNFVGTYPAANFGTNTFIANTGGTETRPTNVAMIACIKYTAGVATQLVTSVNVSSSLSALTFSGGPITSTGTIQLVTTGGSNTTFLRGDGTWATVPAPETSVITKSTAKTYNWNGQTTNTYIDFISIPIWAQRVTVMFSGVSTNGSSAIQIQLGTSSGPAITGYNSSAFTYNTGAATSSTSGLVVDQSVGATFTRYGSVTISNLSQNIWVSHGMFTLIGTGYNTPSAGGVTLAATLTSVRVTTISGTDIFDAGTINIMYE